MKGLIILIGVIIAICLVAFVILSPGEEAKHEDPWFPDDGVPDDEDNETEDDFLDIVWGTEIIVTYTDGSRDNLNNLPPSLEVAFQGKPLDNIEYGLYIKGESSDYENLVLNLARFRLQIKLDGIKHLESGGQGTKNIPLDGDWYEVHVVQIVSRDFDDIQPDSYNLTLEPSGYIDYQLDVWESAPLPDWFYVNIEVFEEEEPEKWIEVSFDSGYGES